MDMLRLARWLIFTLVTSYWLVVVSNRLSAKTTGHAVALSANHSLAVRTLSFKKKTAVACPYILFLFSWEGRRNRTGGGDRRREAGGRKDGR